MALTAVYALTLYFIAGVINQFAGICKLMCLGAAFVGLLASFSNLLLSCRRKSAFTAVNR